MKSRLLFKKAVVCCVLFTLNLAWAITQVAVPPISAHKRPLPSLPGQSVTLLPDGRWLLVGGNDHSGPLANAAIEDAETGSVIPLTHGLTFPRAWHSATLLPDGRVLVVGGVGASGKILMVAEIIDVQTQTSQALVSTLLPRAHHTATLLTEGKVLLVGGIGPDGSLLTTVELWDPRSGNTSILATELSNGRRDHFASLLPDGTVLLWGGTDMAGAPLAYGSLYDPNLQEFRQTSVAVPSAPDLNVPFLEASVPADGATNVPPNTLVALRFSKPLVVQTINSRSMLLAGASGVVPSKIVAAENGMLTFVTPASPLQPGATYTLNIQGPHDEQDLLLIPKSISFTVSGDERHNNVTVGKPMSSSAQVPAELYPALTAPPGVTALSGQVLQLDRRPLANVTLQIGDRKTLTDDSGRFLLQNIGDGHQVLVIDARTAGTRRATYGLYEDGVEITAKKTTVLDYKIWMTALDLAHAVTIPSPTRTETVITTPLLPGLQLHIPANTEIYDHDGKVATQISITPVPVDRPPFPLPRGVQVPLYFTIQPGGAYLEVEGDGPKGARLFYPNSGNTLPGTRFAFWNYDAEKKGWYVYGMGATSPDRTEVIPAPGVVLYEFTGAMVTGSGTAAGSGATAGGSSEGDPVDLGTGLFVLKHTDFILPDVIPIGLTRTYRQGDTASRAFGLGTSHTYDTFLVGDSSLYTYMDLVLPDGGRIHYYRISSGTSPFNAVYQHTSTPTPFYGSTIAWNNARTGWDLHLKNGTTWAFPDSFGATTAAKAALLFIQDRYGNTLIINRDSNTGNINQIVSPNGRWLQFTYDSCNRIIQITDNIGRSTVYGYDSANCSSGRLHTVTDPNQGVTTYNYGENGATPDEMTSIVDARTIKYLQCSYDANGRVQQQQLANGGTWGFTYTTDLNGNVTQTDVKDPNGVVHRHVFGLPAVFQSGFLTGGYQTSEVLALGKPEQQTFTYNLGTAANNPGSFVQSVTDPLGRVTSYTYDAMGNMTSATRLSGTPNAATTSYTYEPAFNRVTSITDPLGQTTTVTYSDAINQIVRTDPLGNQWTTSENSLGQVASWKDPAGGTWQFGYTGADLTTVTDALNNTTTYLYDGAGRTVLRIDPLGEQTTFTYDGLNNLITLTDPLSERTTFGYDPNSNLTSVTDPLNTSTPTQFFYDNMDQVKTRTDALGSSDSFQYDLNGNLNCHTDRKGQITVFGYDGLNRKTSAGFGAASCTSTTYQNSTIYNYDGGNRLTSAVDSLAGTISRNYDGLDDLKYESTPQGTINYNFDSDRRRTSMTVTGQTAVTYGYDTDNRLQQIKQGTTAINMTYDSVGRRSSLILPNGITVGYSYDSDSHVTGITYQSGATTLGNLIYSYESLGRRSQVTGSYARTSLPAALSSALYNAANQLKSWAGTSVTYDLNANLQNDGTNTYNSDLRNQLSTISGGSTASFQYDGLGRRTGKTINGTSMDFLYDGVNIVQELSGLTPTANLITGLVPDEIFARSDSAGTRFFLDDALGSTSALTDASGGIQSQYTYEPFGNSSSSGATTSNSFQFTGRENDGTGLYFYRARYYKPGFERFVSEDRVGFRGGINLFAYVDNNPISFGDPFGLKPPDCGAQCPTYAPGVPPNPQKVLQSMQQVVLVPLQALGNYLTCVGDYAGIGALANGARAGIMSGGAAIPEGTAGGAIVGGITGGFKCAGIP